MIFHVVITETARADLKSYYLRAAENAPTTAARWLNGFEQSLATLSSNPRRCGLAPENGSVTEEIRQFLYGKKRNVCRALFMITDDEVKVLHIRRAAMDTATPNELFGSEGA